MPTFVGRGFEVSRGTGPPYAGRTSRGDAPRRKLAPERTSAFRRLIKSQYRVKAIAATVSTDPSHLGTVTSVASAERPRSTVQTAPSKSSGCFLRVGAEDSVSPVSG